MSECTASSPSLVSHVADMATSQLVLSKKLLELEQLLRSLSDHQEVLLAAPAGSPSRGSGAAGAGALPRGGEVGVEAACGDSLGKFVGFCGPPPPHCLSRSVCTPTVIVKQ
jgi:hypothetical protein